MRGAPEAESPKKTPKVPSNRGKWERSLEFRQKASEAWARRFPQKRLRPSGSWTLDPDFDEDV